MQIPRNFTEAKTVRGSMKFARPLVWILRFVVLAVFTASAFADEAQPSFTGGLSAENAKAIGLNKLTESQRVALDRQIQREIASARQGDTVAFASSFTHRRTPQQRAEAGLDRLMTPESAQLDRVIATAIANRPSAAGANAPVLGTAAVPSQNWVEITRPKMEIHGEMSLTYVSAGSGRSGYGGSFVTTATDPSGKFSFTVGLSQFYGKGLWYPYEDYCDRGW